MTRKFEIAKQVHIKAGHDRFVHDAGVLKETPEFIYNVCADVDCQLRLLTPDRIQSRLDSLIDTLKHEKAHPSSCTPDIIERFNKALDEHSEANNE